MTATILYEEDEGYVVLGAPNAHEARANLIEYLLDNDEIDNFGVCTEENKAGFCDLQSGNLCEACQGFLDTIFSPYQSRQLTATYWKEM